MCTYCKEGFVVNNNICKKINDENNKLSKGVIAGIVVGCSLFFLLSSGLAYYLISKKNIIKNSDKEDIPEKVEITDEKLSKDKEREKDYGARTEKESVMIHTIKRNIKN